MSGLRYSVRIKFLAAAALLVSLSIPFLSPAPAHAVDLTLSPAEGTVGTEVLINMLSSYGSGEFSIYWDGSEQILEQGNEGDQSDVTFSIPPDTRGVHTVSLKINGHTYEAGFTILPSLKLSKTEGVAHSQLTVTGNGFNANETNIELFYDESVLTGNIKSDSKGSWQTTIQVPSNPAGAHTIGATPREDVAPVPFEIIPDIAINPSSGIVNAMVEIAGTGFAAGETGITVVFDGLSVKTSITADTSGSWHSSFLVPASGRGSHDVTAFGEITLQDNVNTELFMVAPVLKLQMASGNLGDAIHSGDELWLSGIGFEENEGKIQVTFDGNIIASGITADAQGSWAIRIQVPAITSGLHMIAASGEITRAGTVEEAALVVSPGLHLSTSTAAIGESVSIDGTGFGADQEIIISIDGNKIDTGTTSDLKGNFSAAFTVTAIGVGKHTVTVSDTTAAVASVQFALESDPPPVPRLISPEAGSRIGVIGGSIVTFEWEQVEDPSGVVYVLEIGQDLDFSDMILRKEYLTRTLYTLTEEEELGRDTYYWRVKAIDGAGNESDWATEQVFKVGLMEWWAIPLIILAVFIVIVIVWRVIVMNRRGGWK